MKEPFLAQAFQKTLTKKLGGLSVAKPPKVRADFAALRSRKTRRLERSETSGRAPTKALVEVAE